MNKKETYLYKRNNKSTDFNILFAYPNKESFALASLGYLWLYKEIDENTNINIERVYTDSTSVSIMPDKINMVGFSFSFDFDFMGIFSILEKYKWDFYANSRKESDPILFVGGPVVTANPEPYKDFFDFLIIGDGEEVNIRAINICKENKDKTKSEILNILSKEEGIYVPSIEQKQVIKSTKKLSQCIYTPILSDKSFFQNTFIIEVERGCANRCAFCLASYINLPIRFAPEEQIIGNIELGLRYTNKIALLGAQVTAHPKFEEICQHIHKKILNGENIEMSVSSLRVDSFKPNIVKTLVDAGQRNLTLAIEAGSERLRKVINKNLSNEQIFKALEVAVNCGLKGIKFYGMIGIPTETEKDIEELIQLAKVIKQKYKSLNITFGFSTYVPKANTPFQWFGREDNKLLEKKSNYIIKEMHKLGIQATVTSPKWDYYQAVLSRGDSRLSQYLVEVYKMGGKIGAFKKAAKDLCINTDYYALYKYEYDLPLPWDFIAMNPNKDFLKEESKKLICN